MRDTWIYVAAAAIIIFFIMTSFSPPPGSYDGQAVGGYATIVFEDGSRQTIDPYSQNPLQNLFQTIYDVRYPDKPISSYIIHIFFIPEFQGDVVEWSVSGKFRAVIVKPSGATITIKSETVSKQGTELESGRRYDLGGILIITADEIEEKLSEEGTYDIDIDLVEFTLTVEFDDGTVDTYEIDPRRPKTLLTLQILYEPNMITNVDVEAGESITWELVYMMGVEPRWIY